ncbi:MAG: trehalose-phosphatase [Candidatus Omnitrophica bacterium]|nr:trehalose-phosphatase [Candidatus Omnitrophota bacterium]
MKKYSFDSVIFDLDGVITQTALVHGKSWKATFDEYMRMREKRDGQPFREFTHEGDYLPYVDGKPRYEGVRSFLESRGIHIPYGDPQDGPEEETACGIGNKKNKMFLDIIKKEGAEVYASTVELIKQLKAAGVRVGVASSSKSCQVILQAVGLEELFETRVDGLVSAELGLKGKPEGDIFVKASRNIGSEPARSVVVEDATSGVQAGRNGGFGLVLGVAREENEVQLLENGADIVVGDLSEIDIERIEQWFHRKPRPLFENWDKTEKVETETTIINPYYSRTGKEVFLQGKKVAFFLDYDGTLTPIVKRPELAVMSEDMRKVITELSKLHTVAVISGRMREDVQKLVDIPGLIYAGSHGFDISGPDFSIIQPKAKEFTPKIKEITKTLSQKLGDIQGILLEYKKFSVAVHYRLVQEKYLAEIKECIKGVIKEDKDIRLMNGKKVFEIMPQIDWDKGKAVRWIIQALKISWSDTCIVYIGDDTTDEDAFRAVRTRGTGVLVAQENTESAADFWIASPDETKRLFENVIKGTA